MEAARTSERLTDLYQTARRYNAGESRNVHRDIERTAKKHLSPGPTARALAVSLATILQILCRNDPKMYSIYTSNKSNVPTNMKRPEEDTSLQSIKRSLCYEGSFCKTRTANLSN
ncbi:hypothetical protein L798_00798 [Zootermopsis nevadensis]|uniref:Uncharacterized protein n=1 Tax=Zootermopsis nevadensis TaxID=136037 RepID=A0A067QKF2_ZOONE|nr:hypothetical protein L798_00798 [Zootermopsis nevadensis]